MQGSRQNVQNRIRNILRFQTWHLLNLFDKIRISYKVTGFDKFGGHSARTNALQVDEITIEFHLEAVILTVILIFKPRWLNSCLSVSVKAVTACFDAA
jgi:hypothetical protein